MKKIILFCKYVLISILYFNAVIAIVTEDQVKQAYKDFRRDVYPKIVLQAQDTPYANIGPAVAFANFYNPKKLSDEEKAKLKFDILSKGFGVGGVSKKSATTEERATMLTLLKDTVSPYGDFEEQPQTPHQAFITKAIQIFKKKNQSPQEQTLRSWVDDIACVAKHVGCNDNPYLKETLIGSCFTVMNTLYDMIITPRTLPDMGKLQRVVTQHLKTLTPIEDALWKEGNIDTLSILATKKWRAFVPYAQKLTKGIKRENNRCRITQTLAEISPEEWEKFVLQAQKLTKGIKKGNERQWIIEALAEISPEEWKEFVTNAQKLTKGIKSDNERWWIIEGLTK